MFIDLGVLQIAQHLKVFVTELDDLSLIPLTHIVEENRFLSFVLLSLR